MAVNGKPNLHYLLYTLEYELNQIKRANSSGGQPYFSNVAFVDFPDYPITNIDQIMGVQDSPALLCWLLNVGHGREPYTLGDTYPAAKVEIVGVVKGPAVQEQLVLLAEDVRRVMLGNKQRRFPGLIPPPYVGVDTYEDPRAMDFIVHQEGVSTLTGVFLSTWNIEYCFPLPTG